MVCYHPLKAWPVGHTKNGKIDYKITGYSIDHVEIFNNDKIIAVPNGLIDKAAINIITDYIEIPCGQCAGCRLDYSRQWADRCMLEMKGHDQSWFVTLTYDDDHLPQNNFIIKDTGECGTVSTLVKDDLRQFIKNLRYHYGQRQFEREFGRPCRKGERTSKAENVSFRFFACGEYGDRSFRPHYHLIIFGLILDSSDLVFYKKSEIDYSYYNVPWIQDVWKKGYVVVAPATWETCAYTARYVMKKQKGSGKALYDLYNFAPEFTLMSRKPGIGRKFFDDRGAAIFDTDYISVGTKDGSKKIYPSRYYKRLFDQIDPERYEDWKNMRLDVYEDVRKAKACLSSKKFLDQLETEEAAKEAAIKSLKRSI